MLSKGSTMNEPTTPVSIEHIEQLVLALYEPNNPEVIAATQATLTQLQGSPQAWSIARDLLARPDEKVKFHGALIIIIKLNTERSSLTNEDATELLLNLLGWYLDSISRGYSPLVTRKLASALATFLIHFHSIWGRYVSHLAQCLASGQPCHPRMTETAEHISPLLSTIEPDGLQAIIWVISNVMDDASKIDLDSGNSVGLYDVLRQNVADSAVVIYRATSTIGGTPCLREDSIRCLQSWIAFSQKTSSRDKYFADALRPLLTVVIDLLVTNDSPDAGMELLADVLSNFPSLLSEEQNNMLANVLTSSWALAHYQSLIHGDLDFESFQFGQLLLGFGEAKVESLMRSEDERSRNLLLSMCGLLSAQGYPAVEDKVFVPALEFWSTYVETLTDEMSSSETPSDPWIMSATSFAMEAVSNAWQRICFPSLEEYSQWDTSDRVGFGDARKEVADLLQSTYALIGPQLASTFSELTLTALSTEAWLRLEAAAFCLGSLSDCIKEDTRCDEAMFSVFSSSLFPTLQAMRLEMPPRVRQTCVLLIEQYTEYFERNVSLLPPALNLLFSLVGEPGLASPASKSINRLCSSCRHHLFPEIWAFLDEYQTLTQSRRLDCASNERILGGISCVAQGCPDSSQRFSAFGRILGFVEGDLSRSVDWNGQSTDVAGFPCGPNSRCLHDPNTENAGFHMGIRALRCLVSIGRGSQSPVEGPIEIESRSHGRKEPGPELTELQQRIFKVIIQIESAFPDSTDVKETICSILRTGFSEVDPGPFVFPPNDTAHYLTRHGVHSPRVGVVVSTACSFLSSVEQQDGVPEKEAILSEVILWVVGLVRDLSEPESDTELSHNAIDFASRLFAKSPMTLLRLQPFEAAEYLFLFTLRVLDGKEPLPKAASAEFWASFMNLRNGSADTEERIVHVMNTLGPLLAQSLAKNIGGNASRSELDKISEPIKKMMSRYPSAKEWLSNALNDQSFPSSKVTQHQKSLFVKKLVSLRGSRTTNQVVRDFWLTARGSNFAYAS